MEKILCNKHLTHTKNSCLKKKKRQQTKQKLTLAAIEEKRQVLSSVK